MPPTANEVITGLLAICGGITTIGAAVVVICNLIKKLKSPEKTQNDRLDALEKKYEEMDKKFSELENKEKTSSDILGLILDAQFALLSHGISGNAVAEMESARSELQRYLINRRGGENHD